MLCKEEKNEEKAILKDRVKHPRELKHTCASFFWATREMLEPETT